MLQALSIRNIILIEQLDIELSHGLTVLTGETGAGKSILLDALSLALGARGDGALVRKGCEKGQIRAVFELSHLIDDHHHGLCHLLDEQGIDFDGHLILRRIQNADGRTRASINDQPVSVSVLKNVGQHLVEIHGQHDDRALVDNDAHRDILTAYGGLEKDVIEVATCYNNLRQTMKDLKDLQNQIEIAQREEDYLRDSIAQLSKLSPQLGEEEDLAGRRATMMAAEKIATELKESYDSLNGQASPAPSIAGIIRRLERKADILPNYIPQIVGALDQALQNLDDAENILSIAIRETDFSSAELEETEERLFALRAAARKFNVAVENLPELVVKMRSQMDALDAGQERLVVLEQKVDEARNKYDETAKNLADKRLKAAHALSQSVMAELPDLKLGEARFHIEHSQNPQKRSPEGIDTVEFYVQTNAGTNPGPLMKVASGGELSRFLLALKVALAEKGSAPTLVFDEIDTGIGGAVADAIGTRLARLSNQVQVLSVTHAPQVAARASQHLLISKFSDDENKHGTQVHQMNLSERQEEIARMLSGAVITSEARAAAGRLLGS